MNDAHAPSFRATTHTHHAGVDGDEYTHTHPLSDHYRDGKLVLHPDCKRCQHEAWRQRHAYGTADPSAKLDADRERSERDAYWRGYLACRDQERGNQRGERGILEGAQMHWGRLPDGRLALLWGAEDA